MSMRLYNRRPSEFFKCTKCLLSKSYVAVLDHDDDNRKRTCKECYGNQGLRMVHNLEVQGGNFRELDYYQLTPVDASCSTAVLKSLTLEEIAKMCGKTQAVYSD